MGDSLMLSMSSCEMFSGIGRPSKTSAMTSSAQPSSTVANVTPGGNVLLSKTMQSYIRLQRCCNGVSEMHCLSCTGILFYSILHFSLRVNEQLSPRMPMSIDRGGGDVLERFSAQRTVKIAFRQVHARGGSAISSSQGAKGLEPPGHSGSKPPLTSQIAQHQFEDWSTDLHIDTTGS